MRRLGSQNPLVAKKVKQVLMRDFTTSAANMDINTENNSFFGNVSRSITYGLSSKALDQDSFEEQLDIVTVSSFEGSLTGTSNGFSSLFDNGSVIAGSVGAISPILIKKSPMMMEEGGAIEVVLRRDFLVLEEDHVGEKKCNLCPIC
jgi:hypothetical protein